MNERPQHGQPQKGGTNWKLWAAGVAALFFSSFFTHPRGVLDAVRAYGFYLQRAGGTSWHVHPWTYYLALLLRFPSSGTPFWTEAAILVLAAIGGFVAWRTPATDAARPALRLVAHDAGVAVRLDGVQGAVPLRRLPRAVRLFQAALMRHRAAPCAAKDRRERPPGSAASSMTP